MKNPLRVSKSFVDDKKINDHHAIIPTEEYVQLDHMTNEERKIYDLVIRRFISVLYPAFEYEQTTLQAEAAGESFTASGKQVKAAGWKASMRTASQATPMSMMTLQSHLAVPKTPSAFGTSLSRPSNRELLIPLLRPASPMETQSRPQGLPKPHYSLLWKIR